ncbi:MAG: TonB family protein [Woeseiaceae bacterium]|nr:TonB family protein [Woeseiaceae bacterium]
MLTINLRRVLVLASLLAGFVAAGSADEVPDVTHVTDDTERQPLHTIVPLYPEKARRERLEGVVKVCFNVTRDGRTRGVRVRESTNRIFEKPSLHAVRASTYQALRPDQQTSGIKSCRTFEFRLIPVAIDELEEGP